MPLDDAARRKGGQTAQRRKKLQHPVRVVAATDVPGGKAPESLDDIITWAAWLSFAAVTGLLDATTVREANRSLGTLKVALEKKHLQDRIRELEKQLKCYQQQRSTR